MISVEISVRFFFLSEFNNNIGEKKARNLNNMLLRCKGKKTKAWAAKHAEMFVGSFCSASVLYVASEEGLFSQDLLPEGRAFKWAG